MKKVLIICHYAQEPPYNTMLRYHYWGKELIKRGYKVVIVAASTVHNTDIDVIDEIGESKHICEGIKYRYIRTPKYTGNGVERIKNMLTFCFGIKKVHTLHPDVIITCGAYLFPFVKKNFSQTPIITDTVDLWPESIIEYAGFSKNNPMIRVLYSLEKKAYMKSTALIFSMEGGLQYIQEQPYAANVDISKVFHINMGCALRQKDEELSQTSLDLDWDYSKKNIVYCGSIRKANNVRQICEAAKELLMRKRNDIQFQIYGNGDELEELQNFVKKESITNVHFYGRFNKTDIPFILSNSTASILTYKQVPLMKYGGSQQKLFDYLASGKPIICNAKFGYNLITRYNCGIVTRDQTSTSFADAVENICDLSEEKLEELGKNARQVAEMYDQPKLVDQLEEVFKYIEQRR